MAKKIEFSVLKNFVRKNAVEYLEDYNINSVGISYKLDKDGDSTDDLCIHYTVGQKVQLESLESIDSRAIPESFEIDGISIPTTVYRAMDSSTKNGLFRQSPRRGQSD